MTVYFYNFIILQRLEKADVFNDNAVLNCRNGVEFSTREGQAGGVISKLQFTCRGGRIYCTVFHDATVSSNAKGMLALVPPIPSFEIYPIKSAHFPIN